MLNPSVELAALALLVLSAVVGFKRIETAVHIFKLQANQLYAQEVAGSSVVATQATMSVNTSTGELFTAAKLLGRAKSHADAATELEPKIQEAVRRATILYKARNWTLLLGFALLVAARILPS